MSRLILESKAVMDSRQKRLNVYDDEEGDDDSTPLYMPTVIQDVSNLREM